MGDGFVYRIENNALRRAALVALFVPVMLAAAVLAVGEVSLALWGVAKDAVICWRAR